MEIKKVITISVEDYKGRTLKVGDKVWYTKRNDDALYYGEYRGLNGRNNMIIANPITKSVICVMPKSVDTIYSSMPDVED